MVGTTPPQKNADKNAKKVGTGKKVHNINLSTIQMGRFPLTFRLNVSCHPAVIYNKHS